MYIHTYKPLHHTPSRPAAEAKSLTPETVRRGYQTTQGLHRIGHHLHDCVVRDIVHFTPGSSRTLSGSNPRCGSQSMQPGRKAVKSRQSRDHWVLDTISGSRIETSAQLASPSGGRERGTRYWGGLCAATSRKGKKGRGACTSSAAVPVTWTLHPSCLALPSSLFVRRPVPPVSSRPFFQKACRCQQEQANGEQKRSRVTGSAPASLCRRGRSGLCFVGSAHPPPRETKQISASWPAAFFLGRGAQNGWEWMEWHVGSSRRQVSGWWGGQ